MLSAVKLITRENNYPDLRKCKIVVEQTMNEIEEINTARLGASSNENMSVDSGVPYK